MEYSKAVKVLQGIAGMTGIIIGLGMTFFPIAFQSSVGISLGDNVSLLSETRAPGSLLLVGGFIIMLSIFSARWRHVGLVLTVLIYFGYGFGRTVSLLLDGLPHQSLLIALIIELIIGGLAGYQLWHANNVVTS